MGELLLDCRCFHSQNVRLQIVEHDDVGACARGSKRVGSAAALHFNFNAEPTQCACLCDCGGDAASCSDVVVLQHNLRAM